VIIIAGHSRTKTADERDAAVAAFAKLVEKARKQDGCLDLSISADQVDPERINYSNAGATCSRWIPGAKSQGRRKSLSGIAA
jgi:quinol monooxygenase YgiN